MCSWFCGLNLWGRLQRCIHTGHGTQHRLGKIHAAAVSGVAHSRVVDPRIIRMTFVPLVMLQKKLKMNDLGDGQYQAAQEMTRSRTSRPS